MPIELYPSIAKIKRNGVYENLPGFVPETGAVATQQMIATSESSATAQYAHNKGEYFRLNDTLYQAIVKINVGDAIVVGTNCEVAVIGNDLTHVANSIAAYELGIATSSHNTGDYFMVNETMYVATADIQVGDTISTSTNCRKAVVGDELSALQTAITQLDEEVSNMQPSITESSTTIKFDTSEQTIKSLSLSGNSPATLQIRGENLFPMATSGSGSGTLSWTVASDGTITFTGTPTADALLRFYNVDIPMQNGTTVTFSASNNKTNSRLTFFGVTEFGNWQINMTTQNVVSVNTSTAPQPTKYTEFRIRIPKDFDATGLILKPYVAIGTTNGNYVPYKGKTQSVTLDGTGKINETLDLYDGINTLFTSDGRTFTTVFYDDLLEYIDSKINALGNSFYKYKTDANGKYLQVYYKSGENWVNWELHNMPAAASNSNTWQIGAIKGLDSNFENSVTIVGNGEFELAFKENGASDYCGGNNHGDENTDSFVLHIDGEIVSDLSSLPTEYTHFDRIDAFEIATVNRCDTPAQDILKHQKIWIFENGKVTVKQTVKFLETLSVDGMLMGMFKAVRSYYPYGIRQGKVAIEDMTTYGFSSPETVSDDVFYFMYGNNTTAKIKASTDNPNDASTLWIDSAENNNKLYYGYYGKTSSVSPVSVPAYTICCAEMTYDVSYSA